MESPQEVIARSVGGAARTTIIGLVGRAAGLLTTILVTHFISKTEYGNANLAMIVAAVANTVTLLSPQQALLTRRAEYGRAAALVHFYAAWSGLACALLLAAAGHGILRALGQPEATPLLWVYCGALVLERLAVIPLLELRYRLRFSDVARLDLLGDLAYVAVTIGSALGGSGGFCLAFGMVARHGTRLLLTAYLLGGRLWPALPGRDAEERRLAREVFRASWPVHLGGCGEFLTLYLDNVLVGKFYQAAAQGLYAVGYTLIMTPVETIAIYGATAMVRALSLEQAEERRQTYLQGLRYMSLLLLPIAAGVALVAGPLEQALLPPRWHGVAEVAASLTLAAMSTGILRLAHVHLTGIQRMRTAGLVDTTRLVLFVLALALAIGLDPQRSHVGRVGWAVSAAFILSSLMALVLSLRADGLTLRQAAAALRPPAEATVLMGAAVLLIKELLLRLHVAPSVPTLLLLMGTGTLVYGGAIRLMHPALYRAVLGWVRTRGPR